jgi:hypothetical protein
VKQPCPGAGLTVHLTALPSSLVTCPVCGRKNLGAIGVRDAAYSEIDGYGDVGDVPPHSAAKSSAAEAMAACKANARGMRSEDDRFQRALNEWYDSREWLR